MRRRHPGITFSAGAAPIGVASSCARAPDAVTDADRLPPLRVEEELRIGSVDDPDAGFSGISAIAVDDAGLVYVLERVDRHVRVYDAEGTRLRTPTLHVPAGGSPLLRRAAGHDTSATVLRDARAAGR